MARFAVFIRDHSSTIDGETSYYKAGDVKEIIDQDGSVVYFDAVEAVNTMSIDLYTFSNEADAYEASERIKEKLGRVPASASGSKPISYVPKQPIAVSPPYKREYPIGSKITFDLGYEKIYYTVHDNYLEEKNGQYDLIFKRLDENKDEYARFVYGYNIGGYFPTARTPEDLDEMINCLLDDVEIAREEYFENKESSVTEQNQAKAEEDRKNALLELEKRALIGKIISFKVRDTTYQYVVTDNYLRGHTCSNDTILMQLFSDKAEANRFIARVYQYEPIAGTATGSFPEWKYNDFEACKRVIAALQEKCSQVSLEWRLNQVVAEKSLGTLYGKMHPDEFRPARPDMTSVKKTPVFTGTSEFSKKIDDVSFDGLDVEELSINS